MTANKTVTKKYILTPIVCAVSVTDQSPIKIHKERYSTEVTAFMMVYHAVTIFTLA